MRELQVSRVADSIRTRFRDLIDLDDVANANDEVRDKALLTRGLAAMALQRLTGIADDIAALSVTDGSGDNGLDAIYVEDDQLFLVQSKWSDSGTGSISVGDTRKFLAGLQHLTSFQWKHFNDKVSWHRTSVESVLGDPGSRIVLVVATSGSTDLSPEVQTAFSDTLDEMNEFSECAALERVGLRELHAALLAPSAAARVDLEATITGWGAVSEPYQAYYGVVDGQTLADWYSSHGERLFDANIRKPLGKTPVNDEVRETAVSSPEHFWYFNNGVTVLADTVEKTHEGGTNRSYGKFVLRGASVVNGAQTVASVTNALEAAEGSKETDPVSVWIRMISLARCPDDFDAAVTRATNTQNAVGGRDFIALDPEQSRLRSDMSVYLSKVYAIKRGEQDPAIEDGCTVVDASVALACLQEDPDLAVIAKSAVGRLWATNDRPHYKRLFNSSTTCHRLWRAVQTAREVDGTLALTRDTLDGKDKAVSIQGNRIVLHLVFRELNTSSMDDHKADWDSELASVSQITPEILAELIRAVKSEYGDRYVTSLFKNATRCKRLVEVVSNARAASGVNPVA